MPNLFRKVTKEEVADFFISINKNEGNAGLINHILSIDIWFFGELNDEEFDSLEVQTEPHSLFKDLDYNTYRNKYNRKDLDTKFKVLKEGKNLPPAIVREGVNLNRASFYLEDGTGRLMATREFIREGNQCAKRAYIGFNTEPLYAFKIS